MASLAPLEDFGRGCGGGKRVGPGRLHQRGWRQGYGDWREMLDREPLDLTAIFLPHVECPDAITACAQQGLHIVVEKPMAASSAALRPAVGAARKAGVILTTPYVWRCHPVTLQMRQYVQQGILGQVVGCEGRCAAGRVHRYLEGDAAWMLERAQSGGGPCTTLAY
jgi:predicted dehydrogenase